MAIEGFSRRYAQLIAEGDDVLADFIADQAFAMNAMSDQEFETKYKDPIL